MDYLKREDLLDREGAHRVTPSEGSTLPVIGIGFVQMQICVKNPSTHLKILGTPKTPTSGDRHLRIPRDH